MINQSEVQTKQGEHRKYCFKSKRVSADWTLNDRRTISVVLTDVCPVPETMSGTQGLTNNIY